jgi:hypothetical protein
MAKNKEETALTTGPGVNLGKLETDAAFADFIGTGFASIETVIFGAEDEGKTARYVGQLIGEGAGIDRNDDQGVVRTQKTFAFHPMTKLPNGEIGTAENVTHVIPASYMMAAACDRILAEARKNNKTAIVGMLFRGQVKTRSGFRVNDIAVFEKYV